ncbi:unnamed protein product [Orchesella dallaii]|uniref:C2H2-type domain-containing protein n=1 Tax=Orchesella dallaii TaxID=48710 RepID=A0ABP1S5E1_9HEXA
MLMDMDYEESFECNIGDAEQNAHLPSPCLGDDEACDYEDINDIGELDQDMASKSVDGNSVTNEEKIHLEMDFEDEDWKINRPYYTNDLANDPIIAESTANSQITQYPHYNPEPTHELSCPTTSVTAHISTKTPILNVEEESGARKSLRSLLKCMKCSKTFTNQTSIDLHLKLHDDIIIPDENSDSDSDLGSQTVKNEVRVNDDEKFNDDEEVDEEHSDVDVVGCSDSEDKLPQIRNLRGKSQPGEKRNAKLPFTQCEICLVNYDCEAAVEKCRVVNHNLYKYVCCHSCRHFFSCHRDLVRHRKGRQKCSPKTPKDLEPAAAPKFPSGRPILGRKFCSVEGCYEVFRYEEWLQVHLKTHGKWDCTLCPAEFGKAHELAVHELDEHKSKQPAAESEATSEETVEVEMSKKMQKMAKKTFSCTRCYRGFDMKGRQIRHFVHDHLGIPRCAALEKVEIKCEICKNPFNAAISGSDIKKHIQSQHNVEGMDPSEISKCTICQAPFRLRFHLSNHMRLVHNQTRKYNCPHCGKTGFRDQSDVRKHLRKVHKDKPSGLGGRVECSLCKEKFSNEHLLREHLRSHVDDDKLVFTCETCQKTFSKRVNLNNHVRNVHEQPKKTWHCEKCAKVFKTKIKLDQHTSYTHTDPSQWKFGCPEEGCGKRCWSRQKLTEHIRTHTKERPFICDFCGEAYRFRQYLRTHLAKVHGEMAAKTLPTQKYTKPFDQELKGKGVAGTVKAD